MKQVVISTLAILIFTTCAYAQDASENYTFVHDLIDCLYRLQLASLNTIENSPENQVLKKLYNQIPDFTKAKTYMRPWLDSDNDATKATAMGIYADISDIEDEAKNLIYLLEHPREEDIPIISEGAQNMSAAWNQIFQTSSLAVWVIANPASSENPKGEIPFIITAEKRQALIKHINKMFSDELEELKNLKSQKQNGLIDDFTLSIPVWSALHLRNILETQTYEAVEEVG